MCNISIFASGSGTNAENIIKYFLNKKSAKVALVLSNNPKAYVIKRAKQYNIPIKIFDRHEFYKTEEVLETLISNNIDFIVLAGFLWLVPENILNRYRGKIINIHPALLPKYGGKGMYGDRVHKAVIEAGEKESGITIHYVNEKYDEGDIIFQAQCPIDPGETVDSLAKKVHELEYRYYPEIIEKIITGESINQSGLKEER
ncbi:MAG TPA: phosphoribosylglycinamide formyltransferase [Bacteroidales bacterium]|nr:phosphoribosylglycinamide formyltransferase [Bacteroidales bacterium]HCI55342.1 phosphoribosylglycinamide formyltransferase [Bacteroidales bacterium]HOU95813.1 phosphoribosylglycinamide formyltransferase [Bacteroidales bacterium]HQG36915.1 phosphoribosylglycinamide formyltransferase [Bacteroidales bacterium]HQG52586.1 phosphoribosylglycinamide formyltransferase [Bacteroidales bacterium]